MKRVFQRLSRALSAHFPRFWPTGIVVLAIAWQYRAPLLGRVWWFEDIAAYFEPLYTAAARQMRTGTLPSWDLGAWSGQPLLGDPQLAALYPPNWLWLLLRPLRAYAWLQLGHAALGAAGMWWWARARGRSREAAALAALALSLGAFLVLETRHAMFIATTAWLPWLGWAIERYAQDRKLDRLVMAATATGLAILGGGWSMLYFGAWVIAIVALARVFAQPRGARLRLGLALFGAAAIGLGLSAVQLLPALAHARLSPRALGVDYAFASSYAWPSWRYLLTLLLPTLYGSTARGTYTGAPDQWELCGYAIGFVATVLVPCSLLDGGDGEGRARRGERLALLAACALACELARGDGGFLHPLFFRFLPAYGALRCPARALYVWTLAAPLLAADGLDALRARLPERLRLPAAAVVVCALALELTITWRSENPSSTLAEAEARPEVARWLAEHRRMGRMVTDVHLGQRFHNAGLTWGVESAVGYSSLPIWRYLHLLWIANHGRVYPHPKLADDLTAQGLWTFESPIVDLLSVSWVVAPADRPITAPGFTRVLQGQDGVDLWHNREAYPRAFVVHRAQVAESDEAQARAMADRGLRPSRIAIVDRPIPGVPAPGAPDSPSPPSGDEPPAPTPYFALARESSEDLAFGVETSAPGVLVVAEPWSPGWKATLDGQPTELLRVDYALRGVALPPGRHEVAFVYEDLPLAYGGAITLTALSALVGLLLLARARRRVPRPPDSAAT